MSAYPNHPVSRRRLLAGSLVLGAADDCAPPPDFPGGIDLYRRAYRNWAGEIVVDDVWTCAPATPEEVVTLANWAHRHGWTLRPQGFRHGWAPLTLTEGAGCPRAVLVDTTAHLTGMSIMDDGGPVVRAGAGASLEALLTRLEDAGLGLTATPAPGDLSVGGALAIGAHGTAIPARGEVAGPGTAYGSLSNRVTQLTVVAWDARLGAYALRTVDRSEPDSAAVLTHLGRAFVTDATLRVAPNTNLRCVSRIDIPADELFAAPGSAGRRLDGFLDDTGRLEAIWFAFTEHPWLKVWSVAPERPPTSRPVTGPYNYPFSDNVPEPVAVLAGRIAAGAYHLAPLLGQAQYDATALGLTATASADIWGPAKNTQLYIRPTTLRVHADGYAVLTRRADAQRVVHEFTAYYRRRLAEYAARGSFPVNGAVEIRVTGLDDPGQLGLPGPAPALSAVRPAAGHPEWDVAVWLDALTLPGTPEAEAFLRDIERFVFATYDGSWATARVEWSKGWAYTEEAGWADPDVLHRLIPASLPGWSAAVDTLDRLDPHRVFTNPFLDRLLRHPA